MSKLLDPIVFIEYREPIERSISLTFIPVNEDVIEQQNKISSAITDFLATTNSPVEAINDLLAHWILTKNHSVNGINEDRLRIILELVNFLYDLKGSMEGLDYFQDEARKIVKHLQRKEEGE